MAKHVLLVLSNATDGQDDAFNEWYTNTHLQDVLKVPGYTAAQRFKLSDAQLGPGNVPYTYLAIYEVESDDLAATGRALTGTEMYIDPSLDRSGTVAWFYTPVTEMVPAG